MILLNGKKVNFETFPNGEVKLITEDINRSIWNTVSFKYESDSDLIKLMFVKMYLDTFKVPVDLNIYYMPYSRMDRVENNSAFSLKYVSNFINMLKFRNVTIVEPHSDVTPALIHNSVPDYINFYLIEKVIDEISFNKKIDYLFFPDAGAQKRYQSLKGYRQLVGYKNRDFETGEIKSLDVVGNIPENTECRNILIVDDLCSYGGTFLHSGNKLKDLGFHNIYLLVAHCENSVFQGELLKENSPIKKIFTTDSILTLGTDKIKIYKLEGIL